MSKFAVSGLNDLLCWSIIGKKQNGVGKVLECQRRAKKKYAAEHYMSFRMDLPKDLMTEFKATCQRNGVSMSSIVKQAMTEYIDAQKKSGNGES